MSFYEVQFFCNPDPEKVKVSHPGTVNTYPVPVDRPLLGAPGCGPRRCHRGLALGEQRLDRVAAPQALGCLWASQCMVGTGFLAPAPRAAWEELCVAVVHRSATGLNVYHVCERFSLFFSSLPFPSPRPLPRSLRVLLRPAGGNFVSESEQHGAAEREPVSPGQPGPAERQPRRQGASSGEGGPAGAERQPHGSPREAQRRRGQGRGR